MFWFLFVVLVQRATPCGGCFLGVLSVRRRSFGAVSILDVMWTGFLVDRRSIGIDSLGLVVLVQRRSFEASRDGKCTRLICLPERAKSGVKTQCVYFLGLCDTALRFVVAVDARESIEWLTKTSCCCVMRRASFSLIGCWLVHV